MQFGSNIKAIPRKRSVHQKERERVGGAGEKGRKGGKKERREGRKEKKKKRKVVFWK